MHEDEAIETAVEDKYIILKANKPNAMLGEYGDVQELANAFWSLSQTYQPILDMTGLSSITSDVVDFIQDWRIEGTDIVVGRSHFDEMASIWPSRLGNLLPLDRPDWRFQELDLLPRDDSKFDDSVTTFQGLREISSEEWGYSEKSFEDFASLEEINREIAEGWWDEDEDAEPKDISSSVYVDYHRYVKQRIMEIGKNSLMFQLALIPGRHDQIHAIPLHGQALYETGASNDAKKVIVARPEVLAERTGSIFSNEIAEFTNIISSEVSENKIQEFFEKNPNFIKVLGYKSIYPKVVLKRDDGTSLSPDFMLEPFDSEFWDILDLKLPQPQLIIGSRDRKDFSAQVHQLQAQLSVPILKFFRSVRSWR